MNRCQMSGPVSEFGAENHEVKKSFVSLLALCSLRFAFPPRRSSRQRYLRLDGSQPVSAAPATGHELFRRELRELGYVEGKNIAFEYRSADNKLDRLPALADELVRLKVDVLVAPATS